jgi:hypothetical protein
MHGWLIQREQPLNEIVIVFPMIIGPLMKLVVIISRGGEFFAEQEIETFFRMHDKPSFLNRSNSHSYFACFHEVSVGILLWKSASYLLLTKIFESGETSLLSS